MDRNCRGVDYSEGIGRDAKLWPASAYSPLFLVLVLVRAHSCQSFGGSDLELQNCTHFVVGEYNILQHRRPQVKLPSRFVLIDRKRLRPGGLSTAQDSGLSHRGRPVSASAAQQEGFGTIVYYSYLGFDWVVIALIEGFLRPFT